MTGISIVVCCYNSKKKIKDTLHYLAKQEVPANIDWEVIIVDNNSTDATGEFAEQTWDELGTNVRFVLCNEPNPGLSNARIAGVRRSQFDLILFCDDDNWLDKDYVSLAVTFMGANPAIGILGGMNEGVLESEKPVWWDSRSEGYAIGMQATQAGDISERRYVWGAGMVIRKSILTTLLNTGFRTMLSDRKGHLLSSGGDSEICRWALFMGYKLWYLDKLKLKHFITHDRLTDSYVKKLYEGHQNSLEVLGWYDFVIDGEKNLQQKKYSSLFLFYGILQVLRALILHDEMRKASTQLRVGTALKIHPIVYTILKTRAEISSGRY